MKVFAAGVILVILLLLGVVILKSQNDQVIPTTVIILPSPSPNQERVDIKASFKIITNGQVRIFTDPKYHNQSEDVYIQLPDPGIIHITKKGITWDDFFKTLPMKLTKECLTTGTGQVFCNGDEGTLKFYLNDAEDKNLLDKEIKDGDKLLIDFK